MNTVSMHRKYSVYTQYLDTMLEHSVVLLEGESKADAYRRGLKELDQIAAELRKEANPHWYEETKELKKSWKDEILTTTNGQPPTIDLNHQRLRDAIDDCQSKEALMEWKNGYDALPVPILRYYNTRMEVLRLEENNKQMGKKNSI